MIQAQRPSNDAARRSHFLFTPQTAAPYLPLTSRSATRLLLQLQSRNDRHQCRTPVMFSIVMLTERSAQYVVPSVRRHGNIYARGHPYHI